MSDRELLSCPFCGASPTEDRIEPHSHPISGMPAYPGSWSIECVACEYRIFDHESRSNAVTKWNRRIDARLAEPEGDAGSAEVISFAEIEAQIAHIQQNGVNLYKFGGDNIDEGRCRELCAMYLREFIIAKRMKDKLSALRSAQAGRASVCKHGTPESATHCAACDSDLVAASQKEPT